MELLSHLLLDFAQREDSIFFIVLFVSATAFLVAEAFWFQRRWRGIKAAPSDSSAPVDDPRFEIFWTLVPALVLVLLAFVDGGRLTAKKKSNSSPKVTHSSSQSYVR